YKSSQNRQIDSATGGKSARAMGGGPERVVSGTQTMRKWRPTRGGLQRLDIDAVLGRRLVRRRLPEPAGDLAAFDLDRPGRGLRVAPDRIDPGPQARVHGGIHRRVPRTRWCRVPACLAPAARTLIDPA